MANTAGTADRPVRRPGPDHPITIEPVRSRLIVMAGGRVLADTRRASALREAAYPVVHYIPRGDIDMSLLSPTATTTYCPYKGDCIYFAIAADAERPRDIAWSYEAPYPDVAAIANCVAFYPDRIDAIKSLEP